MRERVTLHNSCKALFLLLFGLYLTFLPALSAKAATHGTRQMLSKTQFSTSSDEILARARIWTSIGVAYSQVKPYYPDNQTGYRRDCSGFVTMAWGLSNQPNGGLDTTGLATVSHQISKEELQPGDILLNTQADAHAVLFGGWIDANGNITTTVTDRYDALEENGDYQDGYGKAVEHTIPYPYYSGYYPEDYVPMRLNSLSSPPTSIPPTPIPPATPTSTIKPGGMWISPNNGDTVRDPVYFAAHAYPTNPGDPPIDHVNFTVNAQGNWVVACMVTVPTSGDMYSCTVNLQQLGVAYGQIQVSFDVYDQAGNVNFAPNGVHMLTYAQAPQPVPTPTPTPMPPPTPTPTPTATPVMLSSGTWQDPYGGANYNGDSVNLTISVQGSTVTGTMTGNLANVTVPCSGTTGPLSSFSSQDQGYLNNVIQNYGSGTGVFLVVTISADFEGVGTSGSTYYMVLQNDGRLQGFWYMPNQSVDAGALTFNRIS